MLSARPKADFHVGRWAVVIIEYEYGLKKFIIEQSKLFYKSQIDSVQKG